MSTLVRLETDPISGATTRDARELLIELFGERTSLGAAMAARSSAGLVDDEQIAISCEVLTRELLNRWR